MITPMPVLGWESGRLCVSWFTTVSARGWTRDKVGELVARHFPNVAERWLRPRVLPTYAMAEWCHRTRAATVNRTGAGFCAGKRWVLRRVSGVADILDQILASSLAVALLWAVATELDREAPTHTGEAGCLLCAGLLSPFSGWMCTRLVDARQASLRFPVSRPGPREVIQLTHCGCDQVRLAELVATVAAMRSPILGDDWPPQWRVEFDQREADGDTSPRAVWWRAFADWIVAGKEPDESGLADLLADAMERRQARTYTGVDFGREGATMDTIEGRAAAAWGQIPAPIALGHEHVGLDFGREVFDLDNMRAEDIADLLNRDAPGNAHYEAVAGQLVWHMSPPVTAVTITEPFAFADDDDGPVIP